MGLDMKRMSWLDDKKEEILDLYENLCSGYDIIFSD